MATSELEERLKRAEEQRTSLETVKLAVPDWRELNVDQPFYNSISKEYCIPVATDIEYIDEGVIENPEIVDLARSQGLENLFKLFNKDTNFFQVDADDGPWENLDIMNLLSDVRIGDYYMGARPCSRLRYLVCVSESIFETIPENPPAYISNIPSGDVKHIAIYTIPELKSLLDSVALSLEDHAERIDKYFADGAGRPPELDLYREAARLRSVYANVIKMLRSNGYTGPDDKTLTVQFGFGPDAGEAEGLTIVGCPDPILPVINIGLRKTNTSTLAEKVGMGYHTFKDNPPLKYARTRRYLSRLRELKDQFECSDSVGIWGYMGMSRETYDTITKGVVGAVTVWDQFSNSRRGRQIIDEIEDKWPFDEDKKVKTADEVREEKKAIDDEKKLAQAAANEEKFDFVDDLLLSAEGQKKLREELYDSAAAYDKLLNNVDVKYIAGIALRALTPETIADDINKKIFEWSMSVLDHDALWGIAKECIPLETLAAEGVYDQVGPDRAPSVDECSEPTIVPVAPSTAELAAATASETITRLLANGQGDKECLKGAIEKYCPAPARMFGMKGHVENFLHRQTSNLVTWDRENLCPDPDDTKGTPWKVPTINFPSFGWEEVVDITGGVLAAFKKALEDTRDELVLGIVNELLQILYDNVENILCNWSDMKKFGSETIPALWNDPGAELGGAAQGLWEDVAVERFKDALIDWGVPKSALYPDNPDIIQEGGVTYDQRIKNFMEEASACLNPGELRAALKGKELGKNFEVIERVAGQQLPCIDASDAMSVLAHASRDMDFQALSDRTRRQVGSYVCDDTNAKAAESEFRKAYADRASAAIVNELWNKQKQKTLSTVGSLIGMMDIAYDEMLCGADRNLRTTQALVNVRNSDSQQYMNKAALDATWSPIVNTYNREVQSWPLALIEGKDRRSTKGDPDYEIEVTRIVAEEVTSRAAGGVRRLKRDEAESRLTDRIASGTVSPGRQVEPAVLPKLHAALKQDKTFEAILNSAGSSVNFSWPSFAARAGGSPTAADLNTQDRPGLTYVFHPVSETGTPDRERFWERNYTFSTHADEIPSVSRTYRALSPALIEHLENDPTRSMFLYEGASTERYSSEQIMFGNYLTAPVAAAHHSPIARYDNGLDDAGHFFSRTARGIYASAQDKLIEQVGNMFAESPLWQTTNENSQGLLDLVLDRGAPSDTQCAPGTKPKDNLLRTNYEKKQVSEISARLQEQMVFEVDSVRRSALNEASTPAILRSLVRVHVLELALRTVFGMVSFGSKDQSSIFKQGILSEFTSKMVIEKLRDFLNENRDAFADLGDSDDLLENLEQQLEIANVPNLNDLIREELVEVFQVLGSIIEDQLPGIETSILQRVAKLIPFTDVPETNHFEGTSATPAGDDPGWMGSPTPATPFQADPYPWKQATRRGIWSAGFNIPQGPGPFFQSDGSEWNWPDGFFAGTYGGLPWSMDDGGAWWDNGQVFAQTDSNVGLVLNEEQKKRWVTTQPDGRLDITAGTYNDFSILKEGGYFIFEKFIKFKAAPVPDSQEEEEDNPFWRGVNEEQQNPVWRTKQRIIERLKHRGPSDQATVENKEAFRTFFKDTVLVTQAARRSNIRIPSDTTEEAFFNQQGMAKHRNQFRDDAPHLSSHFGNWKLEEIFDSLEYGVRLSYMMLPSDDRVAGDAPIHLRSDVPNPYAGAAGDSYTQKAYNISVREYATSGSLGPEGIRDINIFTIPLFEETEEIPISGENALTIANFYGAEGMAWNSGTGRIDNDVLADIDDGQPGGGLMDQIEELIGRGYNHFHNTELIPQVRDDGSRHVVTVPRQQQPHGSYGGLWNREIYPTSFGTLRNRIARSKDFKILFDFALATTDLVSLFAIYCMYASEKLKPSINYAFYGTKMSLVGALYAAQPHLPVESFFKKQNPLLNSVGGAPGLIKNQQNNTSTSGQSGNAAAKTIPYLVKGLAEYQDPSYALAANLDRLNLLPNGLNQTALAFLAPSNIVLGSVLPPVTPLGITAYGFGKLPGEKVPYDKRATAAQGRLGSAEGDEAAEQCEPTEEEEE